MRQRHLVSLGSLAALALLCAPAAAQNKAYELEWMRLSGATWGGLAAGEGSGRAVANAGDVNNDGYDDFLVGAHTWDTGSVDDVGRVYLVYGGLDISGTHSLSTGGAVFEGEVDGLIGWQTGLSVAAAGDVNNDGFDDFLIGAPSANPTGTGSGRAYLIYGSASLTGTIDLETFAGCVHINGVNGSDLAGTSVAGPGDVNGDGFDDLLIGAPGADNPPLNFTGAAYLIYGSASLPGTLNLSALGAGGVVISGNAGSERAAESVGAAGDVNGDGFPDLVIGGPFSDPPGKANAGRAWIVYGGASLPATLTLNALGSAGVTINGQVAGDNFGHRVSGAGDVNGDGRDDIIIGVPLADPMVGTGNDAGRSYLIYGSASLAGTIEAGNIGGSTPGIVFTGIDGTTTNPGAGDRSGFSVAAGGDFNQDGYADLLIGAQTADANGDNSSGEVYLIHGGPSLPHPFPLSAIGAHGTVLNGVSPSDAAGASVSFAGDLNADGFTDLLVGAPGGDPAGGTDAGETFALYGGNHLIQAAGVVAEGGQITLRAHGTPGVANITFASVFAIGQPPFAPQQPLFTQFGPWWLISQISLFGFGFAANGEMALNIGMPPPGAVPGLLGLTIYMQTLGVPQGDYHDLTTLLGFTVE